MFRSNQIMARTMMNIAHFFAQRYCSQFIFYHPLTLHVAIVMSYQLVKNGSIVEWNFYSNVFYLSDTTFDVEVEYINLYFRHRRKCEFGRIKSDSILAVTFIYGKLYNTRSPIGGYM